MPSPAQNPFGLSKVKHIIAVASCKGGVGKSTVAAGLALALRDQGLSVGLLDADVYGPSLPTLFNIIDPQLHVNEFKHIIPLEAQGLKLMSFGFLVGNEPAILRGPIVTRYLQQLLFQSDWGELDYLIIDMPPGTGDVQLTITQSLQLAGTIMVTTPQDLALVDVARGIEMFNKVNVHILGIVNNMAYFKCSNCQEKHFIFGPQLDVQERFNLPLLAEIPLGDAQGLKPYMANLAQGLVKLNSPNGLTK